MSVIQGLSTQDLGFGASMALWGFRACAMGCGRCKTLAEGYHRTLKDEGGPALVAMGRLTREIGHRGHRKVTLMPTGYVNVTSDELSLIAAFAAAQDANKALCGSHLNWLMASNDVERALTYAHSASSVFARAGLIIRKPDISLSAPTPDIAHPNVHAIGHA